MGGGWCRIWGCTNTHASELLATGNFTLGIETMHGVRKNIPVAPYHRTTKYYDLNQTIGADAELPKGGIFAFAFVLIVAHGRKA